MGVGVEPELRGRDLIVEGVDSADSIVPVMTPSKTNGFLSNQPYPTLSRWVGSGVGGGDGAHPLV